MAHHMTYAGIGVNYDAMDPFKRMAQRAGRKTADNIRRLGNGEFREVEMSRGESVYLIETAESYLAHVEEGLGTKNLVADAMYLLTDKSYYDNIAQDTVAAIVNDMITLGALPLVDDLIAACFPFCDNAFMPETAPVPVGMAQRIFDPQRIVANFGLKAGDHVADFGAGKGYFTIPAARVVAGDGKVYAIDIQQSALDEIRSKAAFEHLWNIEYVRGDLETPGGSHLKDRFIDLVIMANVLFQSENRGVLCREAMRVLREGGHLAMIEWDPAASAASFGPPGELRVKKEAARSYAAQAGLEYDREFAAGAYHYGFLFIKR